MIKEKNYGLKIRNKLVHPWWLTTVSLPGMGQPWKIITLSSSQWVSIEQKNIFVGVKRRPRRGGATMQPPPAWFTTQILYCREIHSPHRVHRGWTRGVDESNSLYTPNTIAPSDFFVWTRYGLTRGECLKRGREVNRSWQEMAIWKKDISLRAWVPQIL